MNIIVLLKQTFDTEAKIELNAQGQIDENGVRLIVNPYDEYAIEEAVRLKEKFGGEITAITVGGARGQDALRTALAMGADKAVLVDAGLAQVDEWVTAEILGQVLSGLNFDIILAGRVAIDDGSGQVAIRIAEKLGIPSVASIVKLELDGKTACATHDIDGGTETLEVTLPAVFTAQKGLNDPRYPSVAGMMKAKRKELKTVSLADLGLKAEELAVKFEVKKYTVAAPRQGGQKMTGSAEQSVQQLVAILREEVKVI